MPLMFGCVNATDESEGRFRAYITAAHARNQPDNLSRRMVCRQRARWPHRDLDRSARECLGGLRRARAECAELRQAIVTAAMHRMTTATWCSRPGARGVVAMFDSHRKRLTIGTDPLNYFPVYYRESAGTFVFGTNLRTLIRTTGAAPDHAGIVEFLRKNWCLNGRTVAAGIQRILPGQKVTFDGSTGEVTIVETSQLWTGVAADRVAPTDEELWHLLLEAVRAGAGQRGRPRSHALRGLGFPCVAGGARAGVW